MITIRRGDDLNAMGRSYVFVLNTERDLPSSSRAVFEIDGFRQKWDDLSSKRLEILMSRDDTYKLKLGERVGYIKVYDEYNLAYTIEKEIKFNVLQEVVGND